MSAGSGNKKTAVGLWPAAAGGNRGVTVGPDGQTDNWATSSSRSHPPVCPGGLAGAQGRGTRGAFVPSRAVLSLIREVGQREKRKEVLVARAAARAGVGVASANRRQLPVSAVGRECSIIARTSDRVSRSRGKEGV